MYHALQKERFRLFLAIVGAFLNALSIQLFITPMQLYCGGILGCSQILRTLLGYVLPLPSTIDISGIFYFLLNVPIFIFAWKSLGKSFLFRTLLCTVLSSLFFSIIPTPATPILQDMLTSCLVGGMICGLASGLTLTAGSSMGGLDILGVWLSKKKSGMTVGRFSFAFNVALYLLCAVLFNVSTMIYSLLLTAFSSLFLDRFHQQNIVTQVLIFTQDESPDLPQRIMTQLSRGLTYWEGTGAYTGNHTRVFCACVSKDEETELRRIVLELDPHAFFIVQEGVHIEGNFQRKLS